MRPKYESAASATRAQALVALGRKGEAVADLSTAVGVARGTADPAMFIRVAATALRIEPDASLAADAHERVGRVLSALSDSPLRRRFEDSEAVQFISLHSRHQYRQPRSTAGLTDRELDVLRLVAAGKSNTQIAADLAISVNTVQRHVGSILNKTGLANRTQAASYAHQAGILV